MGDYKESKELSALNNIWKYCSSTVKEDLYEDYKLLKGFINKHCTPKQETRKTTFGTEPYDYLGELSPEAKQFILDMLQAGEKNLYHSVMAIIGANKGRFKTVDDLWDYYSEKYKYARPYVFTHEKEFREIMGLCLKRIEERGWNSCDEERAKKYFRKQAQN